MHVKVEIGTQALPLRMRLGALRHRGVRMAPSMRMPGVMRVISVATLGLQLLRVRRVAAKPVSGVTAIGD